MYILDTDHLSVLDRGGATASNLLQRLATVDPNAVATSIINYEEQMRGWMSYTAKAQTPNTVNRSISTTQTPTSELLCHSGCRV
jgi:hypothetical protein